jgi:hypothetical protein
MGTSTHLREHHESPCRGLHQGRVEVLKASAIEIPVPACVRRTLPAPPLSGENAARRLHLPPHRPRHASATAENKRPKRERRSIQLFIH